MNRVPTIAVLTVAAVLAITVARADDQTTFTADSTLCIENIRMVDGDTGQATLPATTERFAFRLWGYDAPERITRAGRESLAQATALIDHAQCMLLHVTLAADRYGRVVGRLSYRQTGDDFGQRMVEQGHGIDCPRYSQGHYWEAQEQARQQGVGMWEQSDADWLADLTAMLINCDAEPIESLKLESE